MSEDRTYTPDKTPGIFSWNELATNSPKESAAFYADLFGWEAREMPEANYTMFMNGERPVAGLMDKSAHCDGPPMWLSYVTVEDVRAALAKAVDLGGKDSMGVKEVPGMGSFALIEDPQGGKFAIWQFEN